MNNKANLLWDAVHSSQKGSGQSTPMRKFQATPHIKGHLNVKCLDWAGVPKSKLQRLLMWISAYWWYGSDVRCSDIGISGLAIFS